MSYFALLRSTVLIRRSVSAHLTASTTPSQLIRAQLRTVSTTTSKLQNSEPASADSLPSDAAPVASISELYDSPPAQESPEKIDWATSFHGLSTEPFPAEVAEVLMRDLDPEDVEIKPDGILYLPEIKYRRILNKAFGPGGWGLAPRGETIITPKSVTREYALLCHGRLVSIARGEQEYFDANNIATATEGCKSNALMRCCKDLGVASELWDPRFIRKFKKEQCVEQFVEHVVTKKKRKLWRRKDQQWEYPYKLSTF